MIDGHVHLENGPLDVDYAMKYITAGIKAGMTCIQILDHTHRFVEFAPMYERLKATSIYQKKWLDKKCKEPLQNYFDLIEKMKGMDFGITVRFGLEVCYAPEDTLFLRDILGRYPYDFLIGSIHSIDGRLYDMEAFSKEILWNAYDTNALYRRYYEIMETMIESDLFTQIGHPDQLKLFHYEPSYDLHATYERIAIKAKKHGVYMESNTGIHYRYHHEDLGTNKAFMDALKRHSVKIMSASDAHQPECVGCFIKELCQQEGI